MAEQKDSNCFGVALIFSGLEFTLSPLDASKQRLGCLVHPQSGKYYEKIAEGWQESSAEDMKYFLDVSYLRTYRDTELETNSNFVDTSNLYIVGNTNCCECSLVHISCTDKSKTLTKISTEDIPSSAYLLLVKPVS